MVSLSNHEAARNPEKRKAGPSMTVPAFACEK